MGQAEVTLSNWRTAPFNRWAFHHVRELVPSADIPNDRRRVRELPSQAGRLDGLLQDADQDGLLVLQRGQIVFEAYGNGMNAHMPHILMSVSKSMLGLLFGALGLDARRQVTDFVPEVAGTAYRGASLRDLLDMRAAIAFNEDYLASSGPIVEYRKATGWNAVAPGEEASDLHSFYSALTGMEGVHGGRLHYCSPNTDLLGWAIERATGERYAQLISELLWKPVGAEYPAYITVDRLGAPRAAGGMCATLRDLARVGAFMIENPTAWLEDIERNGDRAAWAAGDLVRYFPDLPLRYRSQWYVLDQAAPLLFAYGIHGQFLFVDRRNQIVIAQLSSQALPMDGARIGRALSGFRQITRQLGQA